MFINGSDKMNEYFVGLPYNYILDELKAENLLNIIKTSDDYNKIIALRLLFERYDELRLSLKRSFPGAFKYMNETNHVENDYIFQLNPFRYPSIPKFYINQLEEFINYPDSKSLIGLCNLCFNFES